MALHKVFSVLLSEIIFPLYPPVTAVGRCITMKETPPHRTNKMIHIGGDKFPCY
jgi:hypothetical protein